MTSQDLLTYHNRKGDMNDRHERNGFFVAVAVAVVLSSCVFCVVAIAFAVLVFVP